MAFDPRLIRLGIEIRGQIRVYDMAADMEIKVTKSADPKQNEAGFTINNLSLDARDYLLTSTSPFNKDRHPKKVYVDAGRQSYGVSRIFEGEVTSAQPSQGPDIALTMKARTLSWSGGNIVSVTPDHSSPLSGICSKAAELLKLQLQFEATERVVKGFTFHGGASKIVDRIQQLGGLNAFADDSRLVVKNYGEALKQGTHVLSKDSGMVGLPEATDTGVKVRTMFTPAIRLGLGFELKSEINKALNGSYVIAKIEYELSTRNTPFYAVITATRKGFNNAKLKP